MGMVDERDVAGRRAPTGLVMWAVDRGHRRRRHGWGWRGRRGCEVARDGWGRWVSCGAGSRGGGYLPGWH